MIGLRPHRGFEFEQAKGPCFYESRVDLTPS